MVDLKFQSFGVALVADTSIMNYKFDSSQKFTDFKSTIFEGFKKDVLFPDFNSEKFQQEIAKKYNETERSKIYSTIVNSLDNKSEYRVSISDRDFKFKVRDLPTINKKTLSFLKPKVTKFEEEEKELLIKRTMELTDVEGSKKTKLQTEFLSYAEFSINLANVKHKELDVEIYFSELYNLKIIFQENTFSIDDRFFDIYVENQDFKDVQKSYELALGEKYLFLSSKDELTTDEKNIFDNMNSSFLTS